MKNISYNFNAEFCVNSKSEDSAINIVESLIDDNKVSRIIVFTDFYHLKATVSPYEDNQYYINVEARHVEAIDNELDKRDLLDILKRHFRETETYECQYLSLQED